MLGTGSDEGVSCCAGASPASAPSSSASATSGGRSGRTGSGSGLGLRPGFSPLSTTPANSRSCSAARPQETVAPWLQHRLPPHGLAVHHQDAAPARHQMQPVGAQKKARGMGGHVRMGQAHVAPARAAQPSVPRRSEDFAGRLGRLDVNDRPFPDVAGVRVPAQGARNAARVPAQPVQRAPDNDQHQRHKPIAGYIGNDRIDVAHKHSIP